LSLAIARLRSQWSLLKTVAVALPFDAAHQAANAFIKLEAGQTDLDTERYF
jgi:hypothetical protein